MITALFSVLLLAAETPATTSETASAPTSEPTAVTADSGKKICKVDPANTGTRMKKKLCLTQNEWNIRRQGISADQFKNVGRTSAARTQ